MTKLILRKIQKMYCIILVLPSYEVLKSLFEYVKDAIKESKVLTKFEQLLLCLIRLRLGVSVVDLSRRFQVSKTTVSRIFLDMLEVLCLSETIH